MKYLTRIHYKAPQYTVLVISFDVTLIYVYEL